MGLYEYINYDFNVADIVCLTQVVALWLFTTFFFVFMLLFDGLLLPSLSLFFGRRCGFPFFVVFFFFLLALFLLILCFFGIQRKSCDAVALLTFFGGVLWLVILVCCLRRIKAFKNMVFMFFFFTLVFIEWLSIILQIISPGFFFGKYIITSNLFAALSNTFFLVLYVDWGWLFVNNIAAIIHRVSLRESYSDDNGCCRDDKNSIPFTMLPLDDELLACLDSFSLPSGRMSVGRRRSIVRMIARRWWPTYTSLALVRLLYECCGLLPAYLFSELVDNLTRASLDESEMKGSSGIRQGCVLALFLIFFSTLCGTFLRVHYNLRLKTVSLHNRIFLTAELFFRVVGHRKHNFVDCTEGDIMNHLLVDVQRVADAMQTANDLWALPVQLVFALYLMYLQASFAFLAGVVLTLVLMPINMYLTKRIESVQSALMQANDERVLTITEAVNNILYVKMCGWSRLVKQWIQISRERYMKNLCWLKYLDAFCVFFWAVTPTLVSLCTFATFMWFGGQLTLSKAITVMALFGSFIFSLNAYPWVINGMVEAYVSWKRLRVFLEIPLENLDSPNEAPCFLFDVDHCSHAHNYDDDDDDDDNQSERVKKGLYSDVVKKKKSGGGQQAPTKVPFLVCRKERIAPVTRPLGLRDKMKNFDQWGKAEHDILVNIENGELTLKRSDKESATQTPFTLYIPNFQGLRGQLIAVIGSSGSDKSVFLDALAGEHIINTFHAFSIFRESIAYVEQQPFLMSGTIRENILFGLQHDSVKYRKVLDAVALTEDINHNFTSRGDETLVGDSGKKLSGGQKVRVALARALYADRDLYLIDDILGSLDTTVSRHIMREVFLAETKKNRKCIIVVTHNEELMRLADVVYVCAAGSVSIANQTIPDANLSLQTGADPLTIPLKSREVGDFADILSLEKEKEVGDYGVINSTAPSELSDQLLLEKSNRGEIDWETVKCYFASVGWGLSMLIVLFGAAMQAARNASDQYVVLWSKGGGGDVATFLRVLTAFAVVNCILALCRGFSFAVGGIRAARRLHDELLENVLFSSLHFFFNTPAGQIINRFSGDVYTIDGSLPFTANIFLAQSFLLMGSIFIIVFNSTAPILLIFPLLFLFYYRIQRSYRYLSRALRRLESAAWAPLLDALRVVLDGGVAIRSFGPDAIKFCMSLAEERLGILSSAQYNFLLLNAWFSLRMELVGVFLLFFIGVVSLYYLGSSYAPLFGMALAYAQPLASYVGGVFSGFASTERELISVERVRQYFNLKSSSNMAPQKDMFLRSINTCVFLGRIEFTDVFMRYDSCGPQVLRGLSFHVNPGEKVAIIGRTGAGKSSIFLALLCLVNIESGRISIDDRDVWQLSRELLSTNIAVIPQQPFVFHGTLRKNVDPFGKHTDDEIYAALASVDLCDIDLDLDIFAGGYARSCKRYQVALARMLLQQARVLLLDEPTSQMSDGAESLLWRALSDHMKGTTVICITHKLLHIGFFDRVIVIDRGRVVHTGPPHSSGINLRDYSLIENCTS